MKKLNLFLLLAATVLALLVAGCGGSSSGGIGGTSIGGGAAKAPISGGKVYVNGTYVTDTDTEGNFTLGELGYAASDYPLTVEIRGGSSTIGGVVKQYADDTVVLDGYMYAGDSTVYLSTFSMMKKRWVDAGMSREEAEGRVMAVFNAIAAIVGFDTSGVNFDANPTASNAFEVVQQGLMNVLSVDESTATNIGSSISTALDEVLTGSTDAGTINNAIGTIVTTVAQNRNAIIQAAAAARGTTLTVDTSQVLDVPLGLNVWHEQNAAGTVSQAGTIFVDLKGSTDTELNFHFNFDSNATSTYGANNTDGTVGGLLKLVSGSVGVNSSDNIYLSALPTMDNLEVALNDGADGSVAIGSATTPTNLNNNYCTLRFKRGSMTEAEKIAARDSSITVTFYAGDNTAIRQTFTIRFVDTTYQSVVSGVTLASLGNGMNFGAAVANKPLLIPANADVDKANNILDATVTYTGADNLDGVFLRFLAPVGFKFNRASWSQPYRNLDIQTFGTVSGNSAQRYSNDSTLSYPNEAISIVATGDAAVGKKAFTVEVKDKTTNQVLASDSQDVYFVTTESLPHIASMDLDDYNNSATNDEVDYNTPVSAISPLLNFTGTVETWGTLSGEAAADAPNCAAVDALVDDHAWKLRVWYFNSDAASAGFSRDGSTWSQNLDILAAGGSAAYNNADVAVGYSSGSDCTLTVTPGDSAQFKPYNVPGSFNRDKVSAVFSYTDAGGEFDYTETSEPVTFKE